MKTIVHSLAVAAALLVSCLTSPPANAATFTTPVGGGGGNSVTGSVVVTAPLTLVNGTNIVLPIELANLKTNPPLGYATNYLSLLRAYTNIIHVGFSNDAVSSALNLTNISTKAPAGSLIIVGPGAYNIPTNMQSLAGRGVDMYFQPGAIVSHGYASDLTTTSALFDDALAGTGATTNRIMGYGEFHSSNALGGIVIMQEGDSDFYIECKSAWSHGPTSTILHGAGSLDFTAFDFARCDSYDVYEGSSVAPRKAIFKASRAYAGDSILEVAAGFTNWGDGVFTIGYGEALSGGGSFGNVALGIADKTIMDIGVLNFKRSAASISGALTNKNQTGSGILRNCTIYSLPASTYSTVGRYDRNYATEFRMLNCTIYGPTGVDPIEYSTAFGKFSMENTRVISGASATNSMRAGETGSRVELIGLNSLDKPNHANITVVNSTNYTTGIAASGLVTASAVTVSGAVTAGDLVSADANISGATTLQDVIINGEIVIATGAGSGKVLTSDGSGAGTWQTASGGGGAGSLPANANQLNTNTTLTIISGASVTNLTNYGPMTLPSDGATTPLFTLTSPNGASFGISLNTNLATQTTNKLDFASPSAGQVISVHSSSAGQVVWTNGAVASGSITNDGLTNSTFIGQVDGTSAIKTVTAGSGVTITDRGTNLLFSASGGSDPLLYRSATAITVSNTVAETAILSYSLPGNTLGTEKSAAVTLRGYILNTGGTPTVTFKIKYGATTLYQDVTPALVDNSTRLMPFTISLDLFAVGSASVQEANGYVLAGTSATNPTTGSGRINTDEGTVMGTIRGTAAEDSTASKTIEISATLSAATTFSVTATYAKVILQ